MTEKVLNLRLIVLYLLLLSFLSLNPWLRPDGRQIAGLITWDLVDHATAYGLLTILFLSACKWATGRRQYLLTLMAVLTSSTMGLVLEFFQLWFTSTRSFAFSDAIANALGAVTGAAAFWAVLILARRARLLGLGRQI